MSESEFQKNRPSVSNFAWASIAGADAEPVEIVDIEGRSAVFTLGCPDPFWMDQGFVVVYANKLDRPLNPETDKQREAREAKWRASKSGHGWRGPR